jgi:aspartyl-tRNA(Asn)/glutamyl-tRNA(Gln) amidotransferase subunit C
MAVTREDVLRVGELARLGVSDARADELRKELSSILSHMEVLSQVDTSTVPATAGVGAGGTPLRPDVGVPCAIMGNVAAIAPSVRDGFFMVPRLATHEDSTESGA